MRLVGVGKRYRRGPVVLDGVELRLEPGVPVAVAGANGSGKSTLLRVAAGCERPSVGRVEGRPRVVGFLPDRFPASGLMSARGYLGHFAAIHGAGRRRAVAEGEELLAALGFGGDPDGAMTRLSKGNAQKVGLAQALTCGAGLLVLDEPWSGLDPAARATLGERIEAAAAGGARVLVTDHSGAARRLRDTVALRMSGGAPVPDTGPPPREDVTIELAWTGDAAALVVALPPVDRWWPVPGGLRVRLAAAAGDALLLAALGRGCSVLAVRRAPGEPEEPGPPGWPGSPGSPA
ncbi:MAG TPA: ATP-binding cassette domain-containing protein [Pseudonocardiaceae bacterium]